MLELPRRVVIAVGFGLIAAVLDASSWKEIMTSQPLEFELGEPEAAEAWSRAQDWLSTFSIQPITEVTDSLIQTGKPRSAGSAAGYTVNRFTNAGEDGDETMVRFVIRVQPFLTGMMDGMVRKKAQQKDPEARILAKYMATGDEACFSRKQKECFSD
jgi:hypothetical protein